jgi:hypothetical protein
MNTGKIEQTGMETAVGLDFPESVASGTSERLDSWKEIACYLRRSIRCVQRWEKNQGLPVRRHQHIGGATVYAYREQLDEWWRDGASDRQYREV